MAELHNQWSEPKSDYKASDQVVPSIFNELANNEKHLKEINCEVLIRTTSSSGTIETRTNKLIFVDNKPYIADANGNLTEIKLIAENASKDGNGNIISSTYATKSGSESLTNKTYNGYTLGAACAKGIIDNSSSKAISTGVTLPTERSIYNGLPTINDSHTYTKDTKIYAPTSQLSASAEKRFLIGSSSQTSMNAENTNANCYMQSGHLYSNNSKVMNNAMFVLSGTTLTITTT